MRTGIRVFLSSTFLDMQAERDELLRRVFPRLRRHCEERGVEWSEVDLRWGLTDEQQQLGCVLPLCLDLADRCRPYFIGLLGERYGWIPDHLSQEMMARFPWLASLAGRSVTELEMHAGALQAPAGEGAFFYFRDPGFNDCLPPHERAAFEERGEALREALTALKNRIRDSGLPVRENYIDAEHLGQLVEADFVVLIDRDFPKNLSLTTSDRLRQRQLDNARRLSSSVCGRDEECRAIDTFFEGGGRALVVRGATGTGKSALVAKWADEHRRAHPEKLVILHDCGLDGDSDRTTSISRGLLAALESELDVGVDLSGGHANPVMAWLDALETAAQQRPICLVIDGADPESKAAEVDLAFLPEQLPRQVDVLLTLREPARASEIARFGWALVPIGELPAEARSALLEDRLAAHYKTLARDRLDRILAAASSSNPLFLTLLVDELRLWGDHRTLDQRIDQLLLADGPQGLASLVLARCEEDYGRGTTHLLADTLGLILASQAGLTDTELRELLGDAGTSIPHLEWERLCDGLGSILTRDGATISFASPFFREAAASRYFDAVQAIAPMRRKLVHYFLARPLSARQIRELVFQLSALEDYQALADWLGNLRQLDEAWTIAPGHMLEGWRVLEARSTFRMCDVFGSVLRRPGSWLGAVETLETLAEVLTRFGYLDEARSLTSHCVRSARTLDQRGKLVLALNRQLAISLNQGELDLADFLLAEIEAQAESLSPFDRATALGNRALIASERGDHETAAACMERQRQALRGIEDDQARAIAENNHAVIQRRLGDPTAALEALRRAGTTAKASGDAQLWLMSLGNQAVALLNFGEFDRAEAALREQLRLARKLNDRNALQLCLGNLTGIALHHGRLEQARALAEERHSICLALGARHGSAAALGDLGIIFGRMGDLDQALALHREEEALCRELDIPAQLQASLHNQAFIHLRQGRTAMAARLADEQFAICRNSANQDGLQRALGLRGQIAWLGAQPEQALALARQREAICRRTGDEVSLQSALSQQSVVLIGGDATAQQQAERILAEQEGICRSRRLLSELQQVKGSQGSLESARGNFAAALDHHLEEEALCRSQNLPDCLQVSLGNQANVLAAMARYEDARIRFAEQKAICRSIGSTRGLVAALTNEAMMLAQDLRRPAEALPLITEAVRISEAKGLEQLRAQVMPAYDFIVRSI